MALYDGAVLRAITQVALVIRQYDEAIAFFVEKLGFELLEDKDMGNAKRWVRVSPPGNRGMALLLARAVTEDEKRAVGHQSGGRVFLFLQTDDFAEDHRALVARGVKFLELPRHEIYGSVAVFEDLYGNRWDLLGPKPVL